MNTPLLMSSASNTMSMKPSVVTGTAYTDCSSWFASDNKEYYTCADNSSLRVTGTFEITYWVNLITKSTAMGIISKSTADTAANAEWGLYYSAISGTFRWALSDGTNIVRVDANMVPNTGTWYFVRAYYDSVNKVVGIQVNNGTPVTASFTGTPRVSTTQVQWGLITNASYYLNGYLDTGTLRTSLSTTDDLMVLYNAGSGQTSASIQQLLPSWYAGLTSIWDHDSESGTVYDKKGSNHLTSAADPIIAPPVYGSELLSNISFETAGAGGADVFANWTETAGDGAIADETTLVHSGSHAAKITRGTGQNARVEQTLSVTAGSDYYLNFWSRGDGNSAGFYFVYDMTHTTNIIALTSANNTTTTYQLSTVKFTVPAGCSSIKIAFYCGEVNGGTVYFDDVSVKQIITASINNGGFDDWTSPTNAAVWTESITGSSTVNQETTAPYSGSSAARMDIDASNSDVYLANPVCIVGKKYSMSFYAKANSGTPTLYLSGGNSQTLTTSYALYTNTWTASTQNALIGRNSAASKSIYIDNVTLTSLGPTAEAGIASGLAVNTNGVSKLTSISSSFNQITLAKRPTYSTAKFNGSLLFDGVDDALVATGDKIGVGDVTVFAVINARSLGGGTSGEIISNSAFILRVYAGNKIEVNSDGYVATERLSDAISLNTSYIVTVTRTSAGIVNFYINGKLSGTANQNSGTPKAGSDTYIGNRAVGNRAFDGWIGSIHVLQRILNPGEIQAISKQLSYKHGGIY